MSRTQHQDLRIGTLAGLSGAPDYLRQVLPHGFESFELTMWQYLGDINLEETAKAVKDVIGDKAIISSLGIYGNPLTDEKTAEDWKKVIRGVKHFGASIVCGFAGAQEDRPVDENMPRFKEVFGEIAKVAEGEGVKIAFENCDMGGSWNRPAWNIAHSPRAWDMMFNEVPGDTLGLEWEPCHQMVSFVDPIANLRKYVKRVYHVHGKDATVDKDMVRELGTRSGVNVVWHRTPGFGDTNWHDVITILRREGYTGTIDIEGWHDPVYRDDLEMTGQVYALNYLKACRGGPFVENPK
ncbi:MAG: sugar phosphate isomerase/epimerase [Armatimonadetes bacterium]|nr:sugar phosphate isomerase/epimerase [Armatimonadota bacterium]